MQLIGTTNLFILNVPYIAIDPLFPHHLNSFDNVPINYGAGATLNNFTTRDPFPKYYHNIINYTTQAAGQRYTKFSTPLNNNKILLFLTTFYVTGINEPTGTPIANLNHLDFRVYT
mgnify:CR=1 FL=1|jgi:hypothetical protein